MSHRYTKKIRGRVRETFGKHLDRDAVRGYTKIAKMFRAGRTTADKLSQNAWALKPLGSPLVLANNNPPLVVCPCFCVWTPKGRNVNKTKYCPHCGRHMAGPARNAA